MATVAQLITRVQDLLSLAGGLGVQTYAEPKIIQYIRMAFEDLSDRRFWKDYTILETFALDGTTGKTTADLSSKIKYFRDIQYIFVGKYTKPLPKIPDNRPLEQIHSYGFTNSGDPACPFVITPVTTTENIHVRYRVRPSITYKENDNIPMDEELLVRFAAMMYAVNDAANQTMISMLTNLYTTRLDLLEQAENQHAKLMMSYSNSTVYEWHDA